MGAMGDESDPVKRVDAMKKKSSSAPAGTASPETLAAAGAAFVGQGRFKEAVEQFKSLVRLDPRPEWKRSLVDAYVGRARALAGKGMVKEALIVLENTIAANGVAHDPWLYLGCLIRQGHHQKALAYCLRHGGEAGSDDGRLADLLAALRLAGQSPPAAGREDNGKSKAAEPVLRCAEQALAAWSGGRSDAEVDQALQGISLRSAFKPLRLILKSQIAGADNRENSRKLLGMIPAESAFAGWRRAALAALAGSDDLLAEWGGLSPAQRRYVAEARGLSADSLRCLDELEQAGRIGPAALFTALLKRADSLPAAAVRAGCLELVPGAPDRLPQFEARFGVLAPLDRHRVQALVAEARGAWREAERHWLDVVAALDRQADPEAPLAKAVIYRHLVRLVRTHEELSDEDFRGDLVAKYLEDGLTADPEDLEGTLDLIGHYHERGETRDWNQWVDRAVQRFPRDSTVLMAAIEAAAERNAYKKAATFAKKLLEIDPINQQARRRMIELRVAHARKQMRSDRPDLAWKELAQAAEWERPDAPSGPLRIAQGLVGQRLHPGAGSDARLAEGVRLSGDGVAGRLRAALEARLMGWSDRTLAPLLKDLQKGLKGSPDKDQVLAVIGLLGQREVRATKGTAAQLLDWVGSWLAQGAGNAWSPAEFQSIAETLVALKAYEILATFVRHVPRQDAGEPVYRFYRIVARTEGRADRLDDREDEELMEILDQVVARQDFILSNRITRYLDDDETGVGGSGGGGPRFSFDGGEPDVGLLLEFAQGLEAMLGDVSEMVAELGREGAVETLMQKFGKSPLKTMPEDLRRQLCEAMVEKASAPKVRPGRRRGRGRPARPEIDFDE